MGWLGKRDVRMIEWWAIAVLALALIAYFHPQQLGVTLYKVSLVSLFAVLGFRLDRAIFPYARPDKVERDERAAAGLRRAILMAAVIIGGTLGV
jgi:hypothetical protein